MIYKSMYRRGGLVIESAPQGYRVSMDGSIPGLDRPKSLKRSGTGLIVTGLRS